MFEGKIPTIQQFEFTRDPRQYTTGEEGFAAILPAGILSRGELFKALYRQLVLPPHFHFTWEGLQTCLCDLDWIEDKSITLVHLDLPKLPRRDLQLYIDVLLEALRHWQNNDWRYFHAVFPESVRESMERLLRKKHFLENP